MIYRPLLLGILLFPAITRAETATSILPGANATSAYSPRSMPTQFRPQDASLEQLLNEGYQISSTAFSGADQVFTLSRHNQTSLCALTPPDLRNTQNIPTSRCWSLNGSDHHKTTPHLKD